MATIVEQVIAEFPTITDPERVEYLGSADGFSGAQFWRITVGKAVYCLRRWPSGHPSEQRLRWIHAVLQHVHGQGIHFIPVPLQNRNSDSYVKKSDWLWELTHWLPGEADFHAAPSPMKLQSALTALAQWHVAAADFDTGSVGLTAPAAGMVMRCQRCIELCNGGVDRLSAAVDQNPSGRAAGIARRLIQAFRRHSPSALPTLKSACQLNVVVQPCIRDIWHDHVLFEDERVSGIVDFGAMREATIAGDVARLLGSLVRDNRDLWAIGEQAYHQVRPLTDDERRLIPAWDLANVLLSGLQWVEWLFVEGRHFENMTQVEGRMNEFLQRLSARE